VFFLSCSNKCRRRQHIFQVFFLHVATNVEEGNTSFKFFFFL
jgi:hypothetical protein